MHRELTVYRKVEAAPGFVLDDTVREMTIEKDGRVDGEKIGRLDVENDYTKMEFIKYDCDYEKAGCRRHVSSNRSEWNRVG